MKLTEITNITEASESNLVDVTIVYDDHVSVYSISTHNLKKTLIMKSGDEINDFIISNGTHDPEYDDDIERALKAGDVGLDLAGEATGFGSAAEDFHVQVEELLG